MNIANKTYVLATNWGEQTSSRKAHARIKDDKRWSIVEMHCGHDVMLDEPQRLAEILVAAA